MDNLKIEPKNYLEELILKRIEIIEYQKIIETTLKTPISDNERIKLKSMLKKIRFDRGKIDSLIYIENMVTALRTYKRDSKEEIEETNINDIKNIKTFTKD